MSNASDEQTETELEVALFGYEQHIYERMGQATSDVVGAKPPQALDFDEAKAALQAWSRKQTEGVLDGLLEQKYAYIADDPRQLDGTDVRWAVSVSAIEAAQARVREGQ